MTGYYDPKDLENFKDIGSGNPDLADSFFEYYGKTLAGGLLSEREKALIGLAVAHTVQCPYCIEAFTKLSLDKGADLGEMTEALHVAAAIGAGSILVHGMHMKKIADKLSM